MGPTARKVTTGHDETHGLLESTRCQGRRRSAVMPMTSPPHPGAYSRTNRVVIALLAAGTTAFALTVAWAPWAMLWALASLPQAACSFDPPPGDHFRVVVLNDTADAVQLRPDEETAAPFVLPPGQRDTRIDGMCGDQVHVSTVPGKAPLGCLDESSQDQDGAPALRVSKAAACANG